MKIEEVAVREAIRYTIGKYNRAVDEGRYDALEEVFLETATMEVHQGPLLAGRSAIIAALKAGAEQRRAFEPGHFQRHNMTSSMIELVDGDNADALHYILVVTELGFDHCGTYHDRFERHGERWLIARRSARMEWARPDSRFVAWLGAASTET